MLAVLQCYKPLFLETNASSIGLGSGYLQFREDVSTDFEVPENSLLTPVTFTSKHLSTAQKRCSNFERNISCSYICRLKNSITVASVGNSKFIPDHKPHRAMFQKDVATL